MYSDIKELIFGVFPFSSDATLIVLGLVIWLFSGLFFRLRMSRLACVIPLLIISVAVEITDVMLLAQSPMRAIEDFSFMVVPVFILVFFQHQGWVRS